MWFILVGCLPLQCKSETQALHTYFTLLLHYSDLHSPVLHLHCTVCTLCPQMVFFFFSQTEQKQANGTDPDMKQPHSHSGITL